MIRRKPSLTLVQSMTSIRQGRIESLKS